jgi:hypothetical protein
MAEANRRYTFREKWASWSNWDWKAEAMLLR